MTSKHLCFTSRRTKHLSFLGGGLCSRFPGFKTGLSYPTASYHPYEPGRDRMLNPKESSYESLIKNFQLPHPQHYNIGVDISDKHENRSNQNAVIYEDENKGHETYYLTFGQLIEHSNRLSNAFVQTCNIIKGDRISILMSQSPETAITHVAAYKTGSITVPLFVLFGPEAIEYRVNDSGSKIIVVEPNSFETVYQLAEAGKLPHLQHIILAPPLSSFSTVQQKPVALPSGTKNVKVHSLGTLLKNHSSLYLTPETSAEDPALIIYTSGTTGQPKGALHAHRSLLGHLPGVEFPQNFFPQPNDKFWTPADWAWIGGLMDAFLPSLHHGVPIVARRFKKFSGEKAFALISNHNVKNMFMPPTALKLMRQVSTPETRWKYKVRSIGSGGETLGDELLEWGRKVFGITINEFYGQTECNLVLGNCSPILPVRPGSMGRPIPGHTVEVVDENGKVLQNGEVGNIGIKSPHPVMFLRYWNKPEETAKKFRGGYLLTGDLGRKDSDGYFWFFGRNDDVIKSGGYRIGPDEIESCIIGHPAVSFVSVVGVPDPIRGEAIKAYIVLAAEYTKYLENNDTVQLNKIKEEIQTWVKGRLAAYEYPRHIEFLPSLPLGPTGKVLRRNLKKIRAEDTAASDSKSQK